MTYDEFKALWLLALRESGLRTFGAEALSERLELRATDRIGESVVEPYHRPDPFTVSAKFRWRWDALHSARTATTEEDMLVELFGRGESASAGTRRPWLRVDISLHASLPLSQPMPLPSKATWALWVRDVIQTLASRAPIIPREGFREDAQGQLEILAYQGEPEAKVLCSPDGELKLDAVEVTAWQAIALVRRWSDASKRPDKGVGEQLDQMFTRVKAALNAWAELTSHLRSAA